MEHMKVLIAEDDFSSRKLLKHLIETLPDYQIVAEVSDGEALLTAIYKERPDIVLADIGLPLLNGMEAIKSCIDLFEGMQVIFITGSDHYALEAFSVRAIDYILKPIDRTRLYAALKRASSFINHYREISNKPLFQKDLMIKHNNAILFIPLNQIIFIERVDRKSVIHTENRFYETYDALSSLIEHLDSRFIMCHRSYILNIEHLELIKTYGQSYYGYFKNYEKAAKISKNKLNELQQVKSH